MTDIDWDSLRSAASQARDHAYAPYSHHPVGAAALTDDGRMITGCNVENASIGTTLCAECGLISALALSSPPERKARLVAFACVGPNPGPLLPCGRCRQLLWEHGGPDLIIDRKGGPVPLSLLLPDGFGAEDIPQR